MLRVGSYKKMWNLHGIGNISNKGVLLYLSILEIVRKCLQCGELIFVGEGEMVF